MEITYIKIDNIKYKGFELYLSNEEIKNRKIEEERKTSLHFYV
jgi:hypothetical protein